MKRMALLLSLALLAPLAGAEIYKWTDAQGHVHFGDKPVDKEKGHEVQVRDYKPGTDKEVLDVYQRTDRIYDAKDKQRQDEAAKAKAAQDDQASREQKAKDKCFQARERERNLDGPVVFVDDYGKPVKVTDAERKQELQELRKWIAANCP